MSYKNYENYAKPFLGTYYNKTNEKWTAFVKYRGRQVYVGGYDTKKQAAIAHDAVTRFLEKRR